MTPLRGISSMATRLLLNELAQAWTDRGGVPASFLVRMAATA